MSERPDAANAAATKSGGLQLRHVAVDLGRRRVVNDVEFVAALGHVTVLLGPNGAGKSTVLKAIAGIIPYHGGIHLGGADAATLDPRARARRVAYVPQASALDAPMPVRDVVAQGRFAHGAGLAFAPRGWSRRNPADEAAIEAALQQTDTAVLAARPFSQLSHGERRRVLIARALCSGAPVLLLDEPTAALDVGHALALLAVLRDVAAAGSAVVLVLHQLQEAAAIADHVVLLHGGRVAHQGSAATVIAPGPIRSVYGVDVVPAGQFACRLPARSESPGKATPR